MVDFVRPRATYRRLDGCSYNYTGGRHDSAITGRNAIRSTSDCVVHPRPAQPGIV